MEVNLEVIFRSFLPLQRDGGGRGARGCLGMAAEEGTESVQLGV